MFCEGQYTVFSQIQDNVLLPPPLFDMGVGKVPPHPNLNTNGGTGGKDGGGRQRGWGTGEMEESVCGSRCQGLKKPWGLGARGHRNRES